MSIISILIAILAFGVMIGVHEAGHLFAAKMSGVLVHEFAIGMGPKLISWQGKETKYSLRLLPIGGFCNLEGENGESDHKRAFCNAKNWQKLWILASGAIMNLILGFVVLIVLCGLQPTVLEPKVADVFPNTPAQSIGLQKGDRIVKMGKDAIHIEQDIRFFMQKNGDMPFDMVVERNGEELKFQNVKPYVENGGAYIGFKKEVAYNNPLKTIRNSYYMEFFMGRLVLDGLGQLITGKASLKDSAGPVGIVTEIGNSAQQMEEDPLTGSLNLLSLIALITINLGLFNLLPIPALDGGRILFVFISIIIRRKVPDKIEMAFHSTGMILLLMLMLLVTFNDVGRIFG